VRQEIYIYNVELITCTAKLEYMFSKGQRRHIELLGLILSYVVKTSNQWQIEMSLRGLPQLECFTMLSPKGQNKDISIML
jgi:hypothetical protein